MKMHYALLALVWPALGLTQTVPQQAAAVASPGTPVPAVPYRPMEPTGASALVQEPRDWKSANATVGQYPGHNNILKWERAQQGETARPAQEPAR